MRIIFLFFNIIILSFGRKFWRLYDDYDDEIINNETLTREKKNLISDINYCKSAPYSCNLLNDELSSTGNFDNKCCYVQKTKNIASKIILAVYQYFQENILKVTYIHLLLHMITTFIMNVILKKV